MKHQKITLITVLISILSFLTSCSPTINYLGQRYTPTNKVDLYFDEADVKQNYSVMGRMNNEAGEFESDDIEEVQEAMIEKAKSVGADAILFIGFYTDKVNGQNSSEHLSDDGKTVYGNSNVSKSKQFSVKLLKYKK